VHNPLKADRFSIILLSETNRRRRNALSERLLTQKEYKMKKQTILLGIGVCMTLAFSSCKSSQSAYSKAYEKAKQQELAEQQAAPAPVETTPVVTAPTEEPKVVESTPVAVQNDDVRHEKVTVVSGDNGLLDYSVVCGSFGIKANAEGLKSFLEAEGYSPAIVFNADAAMYRVVVSTYADRASAAAARDAFKAKYPNRKDFQGSWLLYRVK
jgi:cell division protein FtsN